MKRNFQEQNIIISGVGGQGLITLALVIAQAALDSEYDVKTSELHGLSQRGGSVKVMIRFGKKIYSPLIPAGKANLILALESQEVLSSCYFANKDSIFLINRYQTPTLNKTISEPEIVKGLKKIFENVILISASQICEKELGNSVTSGIFLLGCAVYKNLIPLKQEKIIGAIKKIISKRYQDVNLKTFILSKNYFQGT